jgi:hypothetical protein
MFALFFQFFEVHVLTLTYLSLSKEKTPPPSAPATSFSGLDMNGYHKAKMIYSSKSVGLVEKPTVFYQGKKPADLPLSLSLNSGIGSARAAATAHLSASRALLVSICA